VGGTGKSHKSIERVGQLRGTRHEDGSSDWACTGSIRCRAAVKSRVSPGAKAHMISESLRGPKGRSSTAVHAFRGRASQGQDSSSRAGFSYGQDSPHRQDSFTSPILAMSNFSRWSSRRTYGEYARSSAMARRFDRDNEDVLSEQDLKQLRENLSRLSPQG